MPFCFAIKESLGGSEVLVTQLCPTLCNPVDYSSQGSLSMEFSRQDYWSGLPLPFPGDLPDPGIEPGFPVLQADSSPSEPPGKSLQGKGPCFKILLASNVWLEAHVPPPASLLLSVQRHWAGCCQDLALRQSALQLATSCFWYVCFE